MQILPNQLVELHIENANGPQVYRTRIEDVYDDLLVVGAPLQKGVLVPIRVGAKLDVQFKLSDPLQEGRFKNTAIVDKRFKAKIPLLQLRLLGEWTKTQERMFLRVPVFIDALFFPLQEENKITAQTGIILNLSGGGFMLRSTFSFKLSDKVKIVFDVEEEHISAVAQVVRFIKTEEGCDYGFSFIDLPEQVRKNIIKFVYKRQIYLAEMAREARE